MLRVNKHASTDMSVLNKLILHERADKSRKQTTEQERVNNYATFNHHTRSKKNQPFPQGLS